MIMQSNHGRHQSTQRSKVRKHTLEIAAPLTMNHAFIGTANALVRASHTNVVRICGV